MIKIDPKYLVSTLVVIPLALLISVVVFTNVSVNSRSAFEVAIVNETLKAAEGASTGWYETDYAMAPNTTASELVLYNASAPFGDYILDRGFTMTSSRLNISVGGTGIILISYPSYSGTGYTSYTKVVSQTESGQKLGALTPYVIVAIAIVSTLIGALGLSKMV